MKVVELFAGTRSVSKAFERKGIETHSIEFDTRHENIDWYEDINKVSAQDIVDRFGIPDVLWASPDCFLAGTPVWTDRGYVNIEDVKCHDKVLTHKGNYKEVYRTIKKNYTKFVKLKIAGIEDFFVTPNHPFLVRKKISYSTRKDGYSHRISYLDKSEWVDAENLTPEYRVGIPINRRSVIPIWNGYVRNYSNSRGVYQTEIVNTLGKHMGNKDFWWIIGLYFADGSISKKSVKICCEKKQDEVDRISDCLNCLGLSFSFVEERTAYNFMLNNVELYHFVMQFGKGSLNKTITPMILDLPTEILSYFLDGYFYGDGCMDSHLSSPIQKYSTSSKKLAYGLSQCVLKVYKRYPSVVKVSAEKMTSVIEGRNVNPHDNYTCSFYLNDSKRLQYTIEEDIAWVNIKSVELINGSQHSVYTLSVKDDESYTVYNVAVHNCSTYSVAAIGYHRKRESDGTLSPKTEYAKASDKLLVHTLEIIEGLQKMNPNMVYFIENPRAGMRKMKCMQGLPRYTICYCKYGFPYQKATDIWTNHPNPQFKPTCKAGDPCHEKAPRGTRNGLQGVKGKTDRSRIPDEFCDHIAEICMTIPQDIKPMPKLKQMILDVM